MMRFRGGGVGHKSTREATDFFKKDRDHLDVPRQTKIDDEEDSDQWKDIEEDERSGIDEDVEDDYGYTLKELDEGEPDGVEVDDEYFGPEDDGGGVDPDMEELGYADL
jgi:hypothetical protein